MMIKERYAKVFIKESTRSLVESAQFGIYLSADQAMEHFVEPLKDIFNVAKIALKDIGSGVLYNMRILFTFSTNKKTALAEAYRQSRENYEKEYEPIMKRVNETLGPAKAILMTANPVGFLAMQAVSQGVGAVNFVNDVFREQRKAMKPGGEGPAGDPTRPPPGPILAALGDLKNIFFGESYIAGVLLEVEGESPDIESEIAKEMEDAGVDPESMKSDFSEWAKKKEKLIADIEAEDIPNRVTALIKMMQSQDYAGLEQSVAAAKASGVDLGNYINQFKGEFEKSRGELLAAIKKEKEEGEKTKVPPILSKIKEMPSIKKLGEKATEEDYIEALEESLFVSLKNNLQTDGDKILREIKSEIGEISELIIGPFESLEELDELKEIGGEAADIADAMEKSYKKITGQ
jgi:hypothetical protein